MKTLVLADVDLTLTDERRRISSRVVAALEELDKAGFPVVLASANAYPLTYSLARYLPTSGWVISENGGVVGREDRVKVAVDFDAQAFRRLILELLPDVLEDSWQNSYRRVDLTFRIKAGLDPREAVRRARSALEALGLEVSYSVVAVHVHPPGVNKGRGVEILLEMLEEKPEKIVAIGDSEVDVSMFEKSDVSVALANAPEEVKAKATYVTRRAYGEGFIEAAELLIRGDL
ncbi:MAG: phosphoglycolate phosphatase [Thermofilum sp.]